MSEYQRLLELEGQVSVPTLDTVALLEGGAPPNDQLRDFVFNEPADPDLLKEKRIAILCTDGVEEVELIVPRAYFRGIGAEVDLVAPRNKPLPAMLGLRVPAQRDTHILSVRAMENHTWQKIDRFLDDVGVGDYDALIIPGGAWNPDILRADPQVLEFVREFFGSGKTTAAICHGSLVLVSARVIAGYRATAFWAVQIDLENAGAEVVDEPMVSDRNLVTSRFPLDLPQFCTEITNRLAKD